MLLEGGGWVAGHAVEGGLGGWGDTACNKGFKLKINLLMKRRCFP